MLAAVLYSSSATAAHQTLSISNCTPPDQPLQSISNCTAPETAVNHRPQLTRYRCSPVTAVRQMLRCTRDLCAILSKGKKRLRPQHCSPMALYLCKPPACNLPRRALRSPQGALRAVHPRPGRPQRAPRLRVPGAPHVWAHAGACVFVMQQHLCTPALHHIHEVMQLSC